VDLSEEIEKKRLNISAGLEEVQPDIERLKLEILKKMLDDPDYFKRLANTLDYKQIRELTTLAIQHKNFEAILGMLKSNLYAATDALDSKEGVDFITEKAKDPNMKMPELYFFIRRPISEKYKKVFRRLTRESILKTSLKITSKGIRGTIIKTVPYYKIGDPEFNLDETIQHNPLKIYERRLSYRDIYGLKRERKKRQAILILDTSGSMYGTTLVNAALTTSVLAYNMDKEKYGVVLFNSDAMILKKIDEKKLIAKTIDDILDSEAVGFTNIHIGLDKGLTELLRAKASRKNKFGILISDGIYNRGEDPVNVARKFPKLHVIGIPAENDEERGIKICKEIAQAGHGKFYSVKDYKEIPRTLIKLLSHS